MALTDFNNTPLITTEEGPVAEQLVVNAEDVRPKFNPMNNPLSQFVESEEQAAKEIREAPDKDEQYYINKKDTDYNEYTTARAKAYGEQDWDTVNQWDNYYQEGKERKETFNKYWDCTATGCDDDNFQMGVNDSEEFRYDTLKDFEPLILSARRTQNDYHSADNVILREYANDMTWKEVNIFSLAKTVLNSFFFDTEQEKKDTALQMAVWSKVKGTGEGSRETYQQVGDTAVAAAADPLNLISLAGGPAGATGKQAVQKMAMTQAAKYLLKSAIKSKATVTGLKWGAFMGTYTGLHNLGKQTVALNAEVADEIDWGKVGKHGATGLALGTPLGALLGGGSVVLNNVMNRYMRRKNINNKQALSEMRATVTDEASLYRWLKDIGWSKKEALEELNFLDKNKFKYSPEHQGWLSKETGVVHKPRMEERLTEKAHFGKDTELPLFIRNIADRGQRLLDSEYVNVDSLNVPIPFSNIRQGAFDFFDKAFGQTFTRTVRSVDAVLTRVGERQVAKSIKEAQVATEINTAKIGNKLRDLESKFGDELGDLNTLLRKRNPTNSSQKEYLKAWDGLRNDVTYKAFRTGVIPKKEYLKFKQDLTYIPRVWNVQNLLTDEGATAFSKELTAMWKENPEKVKDIIGNLTGLSKKESRNIKADSFTPSNVQTIFRKKIDKEMDVHRSSHLEHERKINIPEKWEHRLDPFMAKTSDRLVTFAYDGYKRNEFARRFGAKDQVIINKLKALEAQGKKREAGHLRESYFTVMGDASRSQTIKAKQDLPNFMRAVNKINAAQTVTKLGTAAIPNATQSFVNGATLMAKSGNILTAPFKAVSGIVKTIVRTKGSQEIAYNTGVLGEMDLAKITTENAAHSRIFEREFKGPFKYLNEPTKFLRAVGFTGVEAINRQAAATMAKGHVQTVHKQLLKRLANGKADTIKTRTIERELKDLGISDPYKSELTANDYVISGHMFNKHVNFSGESYNLPQHWQTPYFKLFTKFKSFMFYQARFLQRNVIDEALIHGNPKPLAMYLAAAGVAGNAADTARSLVKGKDKEKNKSAIEFFVRGVGNAGGAGLFWDTLQQVGDTGMRGFGGLAGPTVSDVVGSYQELTKGDIDKILLRLVPNVPGKNQLTQQWRDK
jgi:hypothetical protein